MLFLRIIVLAFNAAIITFLVYRLLQIYRSNVPKKRLIIGGGIFLLLLPATLLLGFIKPTIGYTLIYPIAISLFVYLIKTQNQQ
ncbi:MAG: hypothetical protein ORN54_05870 [Cyclobacteriaceae bacterium]|nr:hypothetical protein [Cyclobacteriaceae bacterium]